MRDRSETGRVVNELNSSEKMALRAAEGWLELGDWRSAEEELAQIRTELQDHLPLLRLRIEIASTSKEWERVVELAGLMIGHAPGESIGYVRRAFALHELRRTKEAWDTLLPVAGKFLDEWIVPYNLACYAAQLGELDVARKWFDRACKLGDAKALKIEAKRDPDLAPLWAAEQ